MELLFPVKPVETPAGKMDAFVVEADDFYPPLLAALFPDMDTDKYTAVEVECAYQAMKMEMQRIHGFNIEIRISDPGKKWALAGFKGGVKAADKAAKDKTARNAYKNWRGFIVA